MKIEFKTTVMQLVRFGLVGLMATATHAIVLWVLVESGILRPSQATIVGFLVAFNVSYFGHFYFTFRSTQAHGQAFPRFALTAAVGAGLNWVIFFVITDILSWHYWFAFATVVVTVPVVVFLMSKRLAFGSGEPAVPAPEYVSIHNCSRKGFRTVFITSGISKWVIPIFFFAVTLVFSLIYHWRAPFADHWYIVSHFAELQEGRLIFGDLFQLHGPHWHASGYIVQLALAEITSMEHWAESLASVLFAGFGFLALARILDRSMGELDVQRATLWAYGLSAFLYFSLDQATNWFWGWQVALFISNAGALWAIERLTRGVPTVLNTMLAAVATTISVYGFGTGWILIPIGFGLLCMFGALRSREGIGSLMLWTATSMLLLYHFSLVFTANKATYVQTVTPDVLDWTTYVGLIHFAANFVASPLIGNTMRDIWISVPVAVIGGLILIWSVRILRNGQNGNVLRSIAPFLALAIFAFGCGLLTGLGRLEAYGANQAFVSRHISFGTFFWIGVFVLAAFAIAKRSHVSHKPHRNVLRVLGLLLVLKVTNIPGEVQERIEHTHAVDEAAEALAQNYPDITPDEYSILYAPEQKEKVKTHLRTLWTHRVSVFSGTREDRE